MLGDALERVPQIGIAAHPLVDREVAFEHRAVGAEGGDAGVEIGAPRLGQLFRRRRLVLPAHLEPHQGRHAEPAQLDVDVGELAELGDLRAPLGEDLLALVGIGADRERAADVVEHDLGLGKGTRKADEVAELRMEHPRFEGQVERRQRGKPLAPRAVEIEPLAGARGEHPKARVAMPGRAVADAAEAPAREDDVLFEDAPWRGRRRGNRHCR